MANKKTNLDMSIFTLGGVSFLDKITNVKFDTEILSELCRSVAERYGAEVGTKKEFRFSCGMIQHVSDVCQSALTMTVFSYDGTSYIGEVDSFDLEVTTETQNGDGVGDLFRWPQALGTDFTISLNKFITSNADLMEAAIAGNMTDIEATVIVDFAGIDVTIPVLLSAASHSIQDGQLQMEEVTMKKGGTPSVATGDALLVEILTGDAYVAWTADSDAGAYSGNALMVSSKFTVRNAALVRAEHEFVNQGTPSFVAAA